MEGVEDVRQILPLKKPEIDLRCSCRDCVERTTETYRLSAKCTNCGGRCVAVIRKGDRPRRSAECPHCGVGALLFGGLA